MHLNCDNRLNFSQVCEVRKKSTNNAFEMKNDDLRHYAPVVCTGLFVTGGPQSNREGNSHLCSSVQFSCSVMSDSLWPHGLQHTRLPCPSPTPRACLNLSPLSQWWHPTISFSVFPFSSCLQSFPASGSFPVSHFLASGGQSIGASALVLPTNSQDWFFFRTDWFGLLTVQGTQESSPTIQFKTISSSVLSLFMVQLSQPYWLLEKP